MRIALFYNLPSGGAKRSLFEQVSRLSTDHDIDLFSLSCADHSFADVRPFMKKITIIPFKTSRLFSSPWGRLNNAIRIWDLLRLKKVMRHLAAEINSGGYDVAFVHPCQISVSPALLDFSNVPTVYYRQDVIRWLHDLPIPRPWDRQGRLHTSVDRLDPLPAVFNRYYFRQDAQNTRAATRVLVNSCFVRESLLRTHRILTHVSYHGVDSDAFVQVPGDRQDYVLSVGMITRVKGYDFVIRSLATIPSRHRPRLMIVGNLSDSNEVEFLKTLARETGVELDCRVMVDHDELVRAYSSARCMVYAPYMESFGLVPLEAMACETPVVGIREGGVRETVLDGTTGFLADRDYDDFGRTVAQLLSAPDLADEMGKQGRQYVRDYWNWERAISTLTMHLTATADSRTASRLSEAYN